VSGSHHWAGIAELRLPAAELLRGFAELESPAATGERDSWSGLFFPGGGGLGLRGGEPAELLLPGDVVGRTLVASRESGLIRLVGIPPWPDWQGIERDLDGDRELSTELHPEFVEVHAPPRITPANWVPVEQLPLVAGQKLLLDYQTVQEILVPLPWFFAAAEKLDRMGLKVAVVASSPIAFGISRQTILTAGLDEGVAFGVFHDRDEAVAWLVSDTGR